MHRGKSVLVAILLLGGNLLSSAVEIHVAIRGKDANPGTAARPLRTISAAALRAKPGDTVIVHAGVYRERVSPPRGGTSDSRRITYQAAKGERVTVTGSDRATGWLKVSGDTWKLTLPSKRFGAFNPYADLIRGDWFGDNGRRHHTGCVYLNGDWLMEAATLDEVLGPVGKAPLWYAEVDGVVDEGPEYLLNVASISLGSGARIPADRTAATGGTQVADCSEGGKCIGYVRKHNWVRYDGVDFGSGTERIDLRAAAPAGAGGIVQIRLDGPQGPLLGSCEVTVTGGWQTWRTFRAPSRRTEGIHNLCLVFEPKLKRSSAAPNSTEIYAQFPGVDPNRAQVEINVRPTVFTPKQTGVDFITVRGFDFRNAATNWAPPSAAQFGVVSAYWCKGWIIENNEISYSKCCGVALGKYGDRYDNTNVAGAADPYTECVRRALKHGWNKATVGGHIVRNNRIHHCEQTGIVGSLGCSFSRVIGNEIHDIHVRQLFGGAEMAGIKFHGAIDVVIRDNHIYRCGDVAGIWLDWMAQNAQVIGNLLHDNTGSCGDMFLEMQHGPILIANNLFLSPRASACLNSQGAAFVHNLMTGPVVSYRGDDRSTPFHKAHSTEIAGLYKASDGDSGDHRFVNNLIAGTCSLSGLDNSALPCFASGNVFMQGARPSKFDVGALTLPLFDPGVRLVERGGAWYLSLTVDPQWATQAPRGLVTTASLGKAKVPGVSFDEPNGAPLRMDRDYFGRLRARSPFPGPFEGPSGKVKVWPKSTLARHALLRQTPQSLG